MGTEINCTQCGRALFVDEPPGQRVACPNCGEELIVPDGGVGRRSNVLPPQGTEVPSVRATFRTAPAEPAAPEDAYGEGGLPERPSNLVTAALPWGVSVAFHASLFLILLFLFMTRVITIDPDAEKIIIPDARLAEEPGAMISPSQQDLDLRADTSRQQTKRHTYRKESAKNMLAEVWTKKQSDLKIIGIGVGAGGGPSAYGLSAGEGEGPRASFYGSGGNAYKICYVIDRSGSLLDTFDYLREELKRSIRGLVPQQQFHVIFFSGGKPEEMPAKKLVYATPANKDKAFKYLDSIVPGGQTNPAPAIERAITYKPELIYFMTDGDFPPVVLERLRSLNKDKKIKINTLSFVYKPGEELLRQIAKEHGGLYKHVSEDDLDQ